MKEVLIIDQTKPIRMRLNDICKNLSLTSYEAVDSSSAMTILSKHSHTIGCIVMDIKFDQFDGMALLERIRKQYDHIPVMILTSSNRRSDFIVGLKLGAFDYVLKPFDDVNLITRINKIINKSTSKKKSQSTSEFTQASVNIKDMIQMEIKKAQKGHYVFELFMLLIYKPLDTISSQQDDEYAQYLNTLYPELQKLFWETDHLSKYGTQLVLGVLPFCDDDSFNVVEGKLQDKLMQLQSTAVFPQDYNWALSHQQLPHSDTDSAGGIIDQLQISVRKQVAESKKEVAKLAIQVNTAET